MNNHTFSLLFQSTMYFAFIFTYTIIISLFVLQNKTWITSWYLLTLKMPRKTASENVVCLCRLLNILANFSNLFLHTGKQCGPRSDWSGSTLFAEMTFKITSRRQQTTIVVIGALRVKHGICCTLHYCPCTDAINPNLLFSLSSVSSLLSKWYNNMS